MEGLEMEGEMPCLPEDDTTGDDLATGVLARFHSSTRDDHQHLCAAVGAMAQALKDQDIPRTPVAYFGATASSIDRLSRNPASGSDPVATALLSFLSMALPRVPTAVLRTKGALVAESLVRILGFGSLPEGGVKAGLKCVSHLLVVGDKGSWSSVSTLYGVLIGFVTDHRPKVRKQSHSCLQDVLQSFQGLAVLVLASEGITGIFERFLLLAGGSNSTSSAAEGEGPRGALEVLYILNALKDCLPLMSIKSINVILKYCKPLLDLRQSVVTRSILEILVSFCSSPTSEVAPEVLLDLLCSLALSIPDKEKSADGMASTARLLHVGTKKVYQLNRKMCIVKLPITFNALGEILASEHEEAIFAATEALKGLIGSCVDESLVQQGVDQIKTSDGGTRKSGPTIIEKICAIIEGFLGYRYNAVWDMSFQLLSTAFDQLGESSYYLMAGAVRSLADMQNLPDEDFPYRKQLHDCVGSALGALGPDAFLHLLPLNLDAEDISDANVWLLPILKQYIIGARLSFFTEKILKIVSRIQQKSLKLEKEGRIYSARSAEGLVYSLWSLLPAFCNYPVDTSSSFKVLQKVLCNALRQEPTLHGIICSSLQILIQQNKDIASGNSSKSDDEISKPERKARDHYTVDVADKNLKAIRSFSLEFFSVLSEVLLTSPKDSGGCLQYTIHDFASISDERVVKKFFMTTMHKLLKVTQEVIKVKHNKNSNSMEIDSPSAKVSLSHSRALLLDLAAALLPGLGKQEIGLLFSAIKPAFQDEEGLIQKKAYKILSVVLKECDEFLPSNLDELLELMIAALPSCHFSAKRHRLESLYFLIVYVSKDPSEQRKRDVISSFLTEIILALKEANKKTRNRAYDLLVELGHACEDEDKGGRKENLQQFFNMIAGGLAGETPHMISAAVKGLARLAYEFSDLIGAAYNLLPSTFLLLQRKNREIIKANLGFMKVLVAKSKADGLQMHLGAMVEGLLKWQDDTKTHFKAKVKLLIEMLVKKCGLDAVKAVMPEEHMKLLTNIRKTKERKERKARSEADSESLHSRMSISRQSRWNHTRIFSDFGDEDGEDDSDAELGVPNAFSGQWTKASSVAFSKAASLRSNRMHQAANSLPEDLLDQLEADPLDLLDRQKTRSVLQSSAHLKRKQTSCDEPEIDPEGRLIVHEDSYKPKKEKSLSLDHDSDARSYIGSRSMASSSRRTQKKRQKTTDSGWAYTGGDYTSKKAGGDVKKKDKLEPYAYWPLDRKLLNRRAERRSSARKGMASVMKFTKKLEGKSVSGILSPKGMKLKKKHKKGSKNR
uniref:RRP12-like protein n=1 Tax=Elaeis guineensis var. tenera TaxID=51953 RepID=A0A6I9RTL4_ELAGV|nr:RRP12-like protein [Elaeis guineensis]